MDSATDKEVILALLPASTAMAGLALIFIGLSVNRLYETVESAAADSASWLERVLLRRSALRHGGMAIAFFVVLTVLVGSSIACIGWLVGWWTNDPGYWVSVWMFVVGAVLLLYLGLSAVTIAWYYGFFRLPNEELQDRLPDEELQDEE